MVDLKGLSGLFRAVSLFAEILCFLLNTCKDRKINLNNVVFTL